MEEMTSREVEFYLKEGGDLVFVPFGRSAGTARLSRWACTPIGNRAQPADGSESGRSGFPAYLYGHGRATRLSGDRTFHGERAGPSSSGLR